MVSIEEVEAGDEHINDEEQTGIRDRSAGSEVCAVEEWPTHRDEDLKRHLCEHPGGMQSCKTTAPLQSRLPTNKVFAWKL